MSSSELSDLHKIWLKFLNTTKTEEGEVWLDTFLAKYLELLCNSSIEENQPFSFQWKSSGNILAHQLLSDMYQLCESVKTNSSSESDHSTISETFQKYLLEGRGWKILWTLDSIGLQNLLCLKDLIKLLILHVPVLMTLPVNPSTIPASLQRNPKHLPFSVCFSVSKRNKNILYNIDLSRPEVYVPRKKRAFQGKKRVRRKKIKPEIENEINSSSGEDHIVLEPCIVPASQVKALHKVNSANSTCMQKSMSEVGESDEDELVTDLSLTHLVQDFQSYSLSVIDYIYFILNMFQESALLDRRGFECTSFSSPSILEFALNTLKQIHSRYYSLHDWTKEDVDVLKEQLLSLIFLTASITHSCMNYTGAPNENEIISTLLIISDEMLSSHSLSSHDLKFVCNAIKGSLMLIQFIIQSCSDDYAKIICIFSTFSNIGVDLCCNIIALLDKEDSSYNESEIHIVLALIKDIIILLKFLRISESSEDAEMVIKDYIHHHNDILGPCASHTIISKDPVCCVAFVSCFMLKIFSLPLSTQTSNEILKHLKVCGICCCINPGFILKSLFSRFSHHDLETQQLILILIQKHLLTQLGLTLKCQLQCMHCSKRISGNETLIDDSTIDSLLKGNTRAHNLNFETGNAFWNIFNIYNDLLNLPDSGTVENIAKHLVQIFSEAVDKLRTQIFIRVIFPQFLLLNSAVEKSLPSNLKIKSKFFLSILPYALQCDSLSTIFVNFGGIPILYKFLPISEFRFLVLNVLKTLIISENMLTVHAAGLDSSVRHMPASTTLFYFVSEQTQCFFQKLNYFFNGRNLVETYKLLKLTEAKESRKGNEITDRNCNLSDEDIFGAVESMPENVSLICDLWVLFNEVISNVKTDCLYTLCKNVLKPGYELLMLLLENLSAMLELQAICETSEIAENVLYLVQSLLSIFMTRRKEIYTKVAVLESVKCNLKNYVLKNMEYQKLLFDLLLKCSLPSIPIVTPVRYMQKIIPENSNDKKVEKNTIDAILFSDKNETDCGSQGDSYAGDTEGSSSCSSIITAKHRIFQQNVIEHGEVIRMLFELLIHIQDKHVPNWASSALHVIQILIKLCCDCEVNKSILCNQGIPSMLLESFAYSLEMPNKNYEEFQNAIMDLFVILAQSSVQPSDLKKVIDFFKSPNTSLAVLLKSLNKLVDDMVDHPTWSLCFPGIQKGNLPDFRLKKRLKTAYNTHCLYASLLNPSSAWTSAAQYLSVTDDTGWNTFHKGFSFTLWLKQNDMSSIIPSVTSDITENFKNFNEEACVAEINEVYHIVSLGSDKLLMELWFGKNYGDIIVRMASYSNGEVTCLAKTVCKSLLQDCVWHHVAINYSEDTDKSVVISKVQIVIDGTREKICYLKYKRLGPKINKQCYVLLGHIEPYIEKTPEHPSYLFGSFMLFKETILNRDAVFYLACLGPDVTGITDCAIQKRSSFVPKTRTSHSIMPVISADVLAGIRTPSLDSLQKSLICSYSAERADVYLVYPSISRGFFPLRTAFPASGNSRISTPQYWSYQVQPIELSVLSLVDIQQFEYHGFRYAVERSGGISVFLFLFAYVLENSKCERDIPPALNILLKLLSKHTFFAEDFIRIKGFELLTQMITNSRCVITCDLFEVLLQNSVDYNFLNKNVPKGLNLPENLAIITNASIFSLLLKSVAFAKNTSESVLTSLFSVLDLLLNPKHANVSMNVEKLNHIEALKTLLWLVKKIYIMSDDISLPSVVIKMIPILIEKLLKYKSDGLIFQSICNFLLLLHNASSTYVCHSRSAFFYLLPLDTLDIKKIPNESERLSTNLSYVDIESDCLTLPSSPVFPSEPQFKRPASVPNTFYKPLGSEETYFNISKIKSLGNLKEHQCSPALSTFEVLNSFENMKESSTVANELKWKLKIEKDVNVLPIRYTEEEKATEMCLGLMKLVLNFITRTQDVTAVLKLVKPEIFIILAYTKNPEVCALAIKVIDAYLKAADEEVRNDFLNMKGFHLLANQLFHCPFEVQVIDACFSIIYDCPLSSVKELQIPECRKPSNFRVMAWLPLLALLPNGSAYEDVCHILLLSLNQFLHADSTFIINLLDNGLVMCLIHLLLALSHSSKISKNNHSLLELNSCLKVIGTILQLLASELCSSKHFKEFLALRDILHLFAVFESRCGEECGLNAQCVTCLRSCQCVMFQVVVNFTEMYSSYSSKSGISFVPDEASIWELLMDFQDTLGSFSSLSMTPHDFSFETDAEEAAEPEKLSVQSDVQKAFREVSVSEVVDRLEVLIEAATHFIIYRDPRIKIYGKEKEFIKQFFCFLIKGLAIAMDKCVAKSRYSVLMFSMKDSLKKQLGNLLMSCFAVYQDTEVKQYIVEILSAHPLNKKLLQLVTFSVDRIENFLILLNDLQNEESSQIFKKNTSILYNIVKDLLEKSSYLDILKNDIAVEKLKIEWTDLWHENRNKWIADASNSKEKIHKKMEKLSQEVSAFALNVTQNIFKMQTDERKVFIEELKRKYYEEASERMSWLKLSEQMMHERAVWHIKESYPYSWELDPTEGPFRVRRRLRRCYIDIEPRFLKPELAEKLLNLKKKQPFKNLLLHHNEFSDSAAVLYRLHTNEQIEFTCTCKIVTAFEEGDVEILIGACCIHLIGEETSSFTKRHPISESWPFETIEEIVPRRYELQNNAFEIFFTNGLTYLIAFRDQKDFQCIWKQLESRGLPCQRYSDVNALTQLWQEGTITNFEYLTQLNKLAGRSFNDLMQYPVFPFILSDYSSQYLNINDPSVYRNFVKPVAIQHKYREKFYCDLYNLLKEQTGESELPISAPYHYGSHYSNSGVVLHFLIRLLPYTYHFIKYQDNNFDIPDRAFHSIESSWQLVTKDTTSDVKEIIPEFFFLPEFLCNQNGFDFGVRQSGIRVNDVLLPPWCKQNPRLFILIHRQALESETVKNNINNWIDLVFGYKQTGEAAINAINVFHPATYYGFDVNQSEDPITKQALKVMIKTLGQMPKQLFNNPHPMVSLSLSCLGLMDEKSSTMEVIDTVTGLRWGSYVGSPSTGIPSLVWCRKQNVVLGSFLPLLTNYVFGLGENICLLLNHKKDSGSNILSATYIMSAALVSWGHKDGIIRIKLCRDQPAIPLLKGSVIDPVCLCASVPDCKELFVAHSSGIIYVYTLNLDPSKFSISQKNPPLLLQAHSDKITSIHICKAFSIFVTTSVDKAVVIWDLNRLCYVRSIISHENAVKLACVSDTLGDIASVSDNGLNSCMAVHTINGEMVGKVEITEIVTAICYSTAPEGISVNVIATGLRTGAIRLWSSWDLKPVREIISDKFLLPIRCVTFSADNQHIYASNENGTVAVWEKPSKGLLTSVPKLLVFT